MENTLYPLKFKPVVKPKLWGKETWVLSGVPGSGTRVTNGFLKGNELNELVEIYMDDLLGEAVFEKHQEEFPLLIKFIEANQWLSIQVHPDDALARKRNLKNGKSEVWYVLNAEPGAELISGFSRRVDPHTYLEHLGKKTLTEILNREPVKPGDVFYMPAGRIHAMGPGITLAEIQQTSDTTYRLYDWNRLDDQGNSRELHTELALEAIDFSVADSYRTHYKQSLNQTVPLTEDPHFLLNLLEMDRPLEKDLSYFDSFVIYLCTEGSLVIQYDNGSEMLSQGEVVLIPAFLDRISLIPTPGARLLEVCHP